MQKNELYAFKPDSEYKDHYLLISFMKGYKNSGATLTFFNPKIFQKHIDYNFKQNHITYKNENSGYQMNYNDSTWTTLPKIAPVDLILGCKKPLCGTESRIFINSNLNPTFQSLSIQDIYSNYSNIQAQESVEKMIRSFGYSVKSIHTKNSHRQWKWVFSGCKYPIS